MLLFDIGTMIFGIGLISFLISIRYIPGFIKTQAGAVRYRLLLTTLSMIGGILMIVSDLCHHLNWSIGESLELVAGSILGFLIAVLVLVKIGRKR